MDDKMNRQLTTAIAPEDNSYTLAQELVKYGFINEVRLNNNISLTDNTNNAR